MRYRWLGIFPKWESASLGVILEQKDKTTLLIHQSGFKEYNFIFGNLPINNQYPLHGGIITSG